MTGLEILEELLLGQRVDHRHPHAWDLLNGDNKVVAVLCDRKQHVSIAPCPAPAEPRDARKIVEPYGERVAWKVGADNIEAGVTQVRALTSRY